jgi:hypothetical protein
VRAYPLECLPGRTDRPDRGRAERVDVDAEQMVKALAFAQRLYRASSFSGSTMLRATLRDADRAEDSPDAGWLRHRPRRDRLARGEEHRGRLEGSARDAAPHPLGPDRHVHCPLVDRHDREGGPFARPENGDFAR